jgi:transcriptional regulator with XRE-family HTH domain
MNGGQAMKYDGYEIGAHIRQLRKNKKMTVAELSDKTGLSNSSINQIEQGGRNLSINSLYLLMAAFQCDANTIFNIEEKGLPCENSIDKKIEELPGVQATYLKKSFIFMIEQAKQAV